MEFFIASTLYPYGKCLECTRFPSAPNVSGLSVEMVFSEILEGDRKLRRMVHDSGDSLDDPSVWVLMAHYIYDLMVQLLASIGYVSGSNSPASTASTTDSGVSSISDFGQALAG